METKVSTPLAATSTSKVLLDCEACGAAVYADRWGQHEEWHKTVSDAIREQVEEAISELRQDVSKSSKTLDPTRPVMIPGNVKVSQEIPDWYNGSV